MSKITPFLILLGRAEEAANFYNSVFKNSSISSMVGEPGDVMVVTMEIEGQKLLILNVGPKVTPNESFSFMINVKDQAEVDYYWDALRADGGEESYCGWLKDKFGLSWQVIPEIMGVIMSGSDPERAGRMMGEMMKMRKLDVETLTNA